MNLRASTCLLCLATALPAAAAECSAAAGAPRLHLVELYTSEACSSCPPADEWLRQLPADFAALGFHVSYWDTFGWGDRFADSRYALRQEEQARRDRAGALYTPQVVIDGRSRADWQRVDRVSAPAPGLASTRLAVNATAPLRVTVDTVFEHPTEALGFHTLLVATEDGLTSQVRGGENHGLVLHHDHVARALAGPLPLHAETELPLPADANAAHVTVVALVQRGDGAIAQVVACPLHEAGRPAPDPAAR